MLGSLRLGLRWIAAHARVTGSLILAFAALLAGMQLIRVVGAAVQHGSPREETASSSSPAGADLADEGAFWANPVHPPRTATVTCTIEATTRGYRMHAHYSLSLAANDPLLKALRTGAKNLAYVSDLSGLVFTSPDESEARFIPYLIASPTATTATATLELDWRIENPNQHVTISFGPNPPYRLIDTNDVSVEFKLSGFTVESVTGSMPKSQGKNSLTLEWAAGTQRIELHREVESASSTEAPPASSSGNKLRRYWPLWPGMIVVPLLFFMIATRKAPPKIKPIARVATTGGTTVLIVLATALVPTGWALDGWWNVEWALMAAYLLAPLPVALAAAPTGFSVASLRRPDVLWASFGGAAASIAAGTATIAMWVGPSTFGRAMVLLILTFACAATAAALAIRGSKATVCLAAGAVAAAIAVAPLAIYHFDDGYWPLVGQLGAALAWMLPLLVLAAAIELPKRVFYWLSGIALLSFVMLGRLLDEVVSAVSYKSTDWFIGLPVDNFYLIVVAGLALIGLAVALVWVSRHQASPDDLQRAAIICVPVTLSALPFSTFSVQAALSMIITLVSLWVLVPPGRLVVAEHLFRVSRRQHREAMQRHLDHQTALAGSVALRRAVIPRIAGGEPADALVTQANTMRRAARSGSDVHVTHAIAFASSGGVLPYRNGISAAQAAAWLALPMIVFEIVVGISVFQKEPFIVCLAFMGYVMRWLAYGFLFGYLNPALRGSTPLAKAGGLAIAISVIELSRLLAEADLDSDAAVVAVVRLGQTLVFCLGLGMFWERRCCMQAGAAWGQVRDFRTIRALAVPVSTIVVAIATTAVTIVASAAVSAVVGPPQSVPTARTEETDVKPAPAIPPTPSPTAQVSPSPTS
ncbi:hypothetical protein [Dactylosporangium sp. NPDC000521]|uniref:hypothetical protein n=1 Tax=Dactylosporangium sp. NPDC000521 TaxID=3363975 RepID=UPI0036785996